ncbi:MAG TPA: hypothetical protein VKY65_15990 [Alphaproteobacteria bacterium]|nr:hypothetical protein [Alphaproteobacteria bacterium]
MPEREPAEDDPWQHQRRLARSLVKTLGFDAAADACRRAGWLGVLKVLQEEKDEAARA